MGRLISTCPCCKGELHITTLQCANCGMELKNDFSFSIFDQLDNDQYEFLLTFLKCRGSLKNVQEALGISYPTAKKQLDNLLISLNLSTPEEDFPMNIDLTNVEADRHSAKASEIIKGKLLDHGGHVIIRTARGLPCEIFADPDGKSFHSDKLPSKPLYCYDVFDAIVDLLVRQGGKARKGNGRNFRLGEAGCEKNTVVGAVALHCGKKEGDSIFDPVFVLAAVLEWAGIAVNGRGELVLCKKYTEVLQHKPTTILPFRG